MCQIDNDPNCAARTDTYPAPIRADMIDPFIALINELAAPNEAFKNDIAAGFAQNPADFKEIDECLFRCYAFIKTVEEDHPALKDCWSTRMERLLGQTDSFMANFAEYIYTAKVGHICGPDAGKHWDKFLGDYPLWRSRVRRFFSRAIGGDGSDGGSESSSLAARAGKLHASLKRSKS